MAEARARHLKRESVGPAARTAEDARRVVCALTEDNARLAEAREEERKGKNVF